MRLLNGGNKRKGGSKLFHIAENDFAVTVMTKWKLGLTILPNLCIYVSFVICLKVIFILDQF